MGDSYKRLIRGLEKLRIEKSAVDDIIANVGSKDYSCRYANDEMIVCVETKDLAPIESEKGITLYFEGGGLTENIIEAIMNDIYRKSLKNSAPFTFCYRENGVGVTIKINGLGL